MPRKATSWKQPAAQLLGILPRVGKSRCCPQHRANDELNDSGTRVLHKNPPSLLSPGRYQVNSGFIRGRGNSLPWLLKAILLTSLTPSCAYARRRRSQKEIKFAKPPERLRAGEGWFRGGVAPPGSTVGFPGDVNILAPPLPPGYPSCRTAQTGSIGSHTPVPSSLGCTGSSKVPTRDGCRSSGLSPAAASPLGVSTPNPFTPRQPLLPVLSLCFLTVSISRDRRSRYPGAC